MDNLIQKFCESKMADYIGYTLMGIVLGSYGLFMIVTLIKLTWKALWGN